MNSRDYKERYLNNINEAVTEELNKRLFGQFKDHPALRDAIETSKRIMAEQQERGDGPFDTETYYVRRYRDQKGEKKIDAYYFAYQKQREVLDWMIGLIYERNTGRFKDKEEIFDLFARGAIQGNILPLARIVEETFGKGSFRKLAELDSLLESSPDKNDNEHIRMLFKKYFETSDVTERQKIESQLRNFVEEEKETRSDVLHA